MMSTGWLVGSAAPSEVYNAPLFAKRYSSSEL